MKTHTSLSSVIKTFIVLAVLTLLTTMNQAPMPVSADPAPPPGPIYLPWVHAVSENAVEILPNYSAWYDEYDHMYYGFGELINHLDEDVLVETLKADIFDVQGKYVRTVTLDVSVLLSKAATKNDKTCFFYRFEDLLRTEPDLGYFKFKEPRFLVDNLGWQIISNEFEVVDSILYEDGVIEGHVKNNDIWVPRQTRVIATYYDQAKQVVGCSGTYVDMYDPFEPGETEPFRILPNSYYFNESSFDSHRLQVFGVEYGFYVSDSK